MILQVLGILIALPASMVAAVNLFRLLRPGRGKHRKR